MNSPTNKPFWKSKTLLVQALALAAMFVPPVAAWVAANPVEFVAALGAVNTLVRFATSGRVTLFPPDDDVSGNGSSVGAGVSGGTSTVADGGGPVAKMVRGSGVPWLVAPACALLASCVVGVDEAGNYSVRPDPNSIDAVLKYAIRHQEDAKGAPVEWVYYDPKTGKPIDPKDYAAWGIKP
jgi:hypothetical protein